MLNGLCQQTEEEEKSMKVLTALNNATDCIAGATDTACAYAYLGLKQYSNSWHDAAARTRGYFEQAMTLTSSGKDQEKDLKRAMHYLDEMTKVYENEEKTHECRQLFDRLYYPYRKNFYKAFGVDPKPRTPEDIAADQERLDPYELRDSMSALFKDSIHKNNLHILKLKNILDRAMDREKMISARAAMQRLEMIDKLKFVLISAIVITVAISTFIALFLMRSISRRLQHIMQNTERLARREALDAPLNGYDEIALLDAVLFETGNRLMELETFKRELVSIVSRELRTPLLSISSALELFSTGMLGELTDKGKNRLKHAQLEADRLIRLINDLLDIEKMDAGKFVLDFSEHRVSDLLETSASAAAQLAEAKSISLEIRNQDADQVIFVDRDRLCQVFINLLSNAIKYSPENGSIVITAEKPEDGQIKFSIIDQGRGIPEELRQRIFDRFVQVEKADATERGGTGLGLAICKAIVDQHGGEIGVDSQMGVGSTFWFRIPIRPLNIIARVEEPKLLTTEV
jgi:signal transduction histidine kinase